MRQELHDARALRILECADQGRSQRECAKQLGLNPATVSKYAKAYGIRFQARKLSPRDLEEARDNGLSRQQLADKFGVSYWTVHKAAHHYGIKLDRPGTGPSDTARVEAMEAMYRAGKTLEEIGGLYDLTRERVRQILSKHTRTTSVDGGQAIRARLERERRRAKREAECYLKHGCSTAQLKQLRRLGREMMLSGETRYRTPIGAYVSQRNNAVARNIEWNLPLWDWWSIWQRSGKWEERGRRGDAYVMCRFKDDGPYEVGNVYIATLRHNSTVQPNNPYRSGHPDHEKVVTRVSPKPRRKSEGRKHDLPLGVTLDRGRYQAQIGWAGKNHYLGRFDDPQQAHSAYLTALAEFQAGAKEAA